MTSLSTDKPSNKRVPLSSVEFLNTKPLIYGLANNPQAHSFDISYDVPSVCAENLAAGLAEIALIPSIEYSRIRRHRPLSIAPDIGIVSRGDVSSVFLVFNQALEKIEKVCVDTSSRTSVALLDIILREKYDTQATFIPWKADLTEMLRTADAALVIGDYALDASQSVENKLDLGDEWHDLTDGLPFVYSFWAGVPSAITSRDVDALLQSRDEGVTNIKGIADEYAKGRPLDAEFYADYLSTKIFYHLGKSELDGLREFYSYCFYYGIIDEVPDLTFLGDTDSKGAA